MKDYFIGVDLGGTKILTAVADKKGNILAKKKLPTEANKGTKGIINNIYLSIVKVLEEAGLKKDEIIRIGIGSPGPLNIKEGIIYENSNLPWKNVSIIKLLKEKINIPILLENDANAAALGEKWFGAGRGVANLIYVTVSTGIGGGIIINQKIYHGVSDAAGEVGHMIIDPDGPLCGCGKYGCLETFASGTAITKMGREAVKSKQNTLLADLSGGKLEKINGGLIAEAARKGDQLAQDIWAKAGDYLGIGLANLLNIFNPEMIILGGGVINAGDLIMEPMLKSIKHRSFKSAFDSVKICKAALGDDTGVIGALAVAMGDNLLS